MKNPGGRPSKFEITTRREKVKELYLRGKTISGIATALGVGYDAVESDVQFLQAKYTKMVINNPHLAERQFAKVEQMLDEISITKAKYWDIFKELEDRVEASNKIVADWEREVKVAKAHLAEVEKGDDQKAIRQARRALDFISRPPRVSTYVSQRIDTLKAILDRVEKESKLLGLFNPQQLIDKNYVSIEVLKTVMLVIREIIMDLIPEDRRGYAFQRLRAIDVQAVRTEDVVDAEILDRPVEATPEKPKIGAQAEVPTVAVKTQEWPAGTYPYNTEAPKVEEPKPTQPESTESSLDDVEL